MKIHLSREERDTLAKVAERYEVEPGKLEEMYYEVMSVHFHQYLCDIAEINWYELTG